MWWMSKSNVEVVELWLKQAFMKNWTVALMPELTDFVAVLSQIAALPEAPSRKVRSRVEYVGLKQGYSADDKVHAFVFTRRGSDSVSFMAVTPSPGKMFDPGDIALRVAEVVLGEESGHPYDIQLASHDGSAVEGVREVVFNGKAHEFVLQASPDTVRLYPRNPLVLTAEARRLVESRLEQACDHYIIFNPAA